MFLTEQEKISAIPEGKDRIEDFDTNLLVRCVSHCLNVTGDSDFPDFAKASLPTEMSSRFRVGQTIADAVKVVPYFLLKKKTIPTILTETGLQGRAWFPPVFVPQSERFSCALEFHGGAAAERRDPRGGNPRCVSPGQKKVIDVWQVELRSC